MTAIFIVRVDMKRWGYIDTARLTVIGKIYGILAVICKAACRTGAHAFVAMPLTIKYIGGVFYRPV